MRRIWCGLLVVCIVLLLVGSTSQAEGIVTYSDNEVYTSLVNSAYYALPKCFQVCSEVQLTDAEYLTMWYSSIEKKSQNYGFTTSVGANSIYGETRDNGLIVLSTNVDKNVLIFVLYHEIGHILDSGQSNNLTSSDISVMSELAAASPVNNSQHITTTSEAFAESFAWYIWQPSILQNNAENLYNMWYKYESNSSKELEYIEVVEIKEEEEIKKEENVEHNEVTIVESNEVTVEEGIAEEALSYSVSSGDNSSLRLDVLYTVEFTLTDKQLGYLAEDGYLDVEISIDGIEPNKEYIMVQGDVLNTVVSQDDMSVELRLYSNNPVSIYTLRSIEDSESSEVQETVEPIVIEYITAQVTFSTYILDILIIVVCFLCMIEILITVKRN